MNMRIIAAKQTAQGQAASEGHKLLLATSFDLKPEINKIESKVIGSGRWKKDTMAGRLSVKGDVGLEPTIDQVEMFLEGAGFNKNSTTYKSAALNNFITFVQDFPEDDLSIKYEDCMINTLTFTVNQEAYVEMKANVVGLKNENSESKFAGEVATTEEAQLVCYGAVLKEKGTDISATVESVELSIENSLDLKSGLNSRFNTKILQSGRGSITATVKFNSFEKNNYLKAMKMLTDNTSTSLELLLKEDITTSEGTNGKKIKIEMPNVKLTNVTVEDLEGAGGLTKTLDVLPDSHGEPITFEISDRG